VQAGAQDVQAGAQDVQAGAQAEASAQAEAGAQDAKADDAKGKWSWQGTSWEGWVPGLSQQAAKARAYHRDVRWEAHLTNKALGAPSTRSRPYGRECPHCDDNLRKSDCDFGLCGKCCGLAHKYDACAAHRPWL
jgi:hypothetical protein